MENADIFDDTLSARSAILLADKNLRSMPEDNVIISSPQALQVKKQKMAQGPLLILSDFDKTLTTQNVNVNGELVYGVTTFSVFNNEEYFSKDFVKDTQEEYEEYVRYEFSNVLSYTEKAAYVEEWFMTFFKRLTKENARKEAMEKATRDAILSFRQGAFQVFRLCQIFGIPFLILSAGISQVIEKLLEVHTPNPSVVSDLEIYANNLIFDENGYIQDFSKPVVHSLNKFESFRDSVNASYRRHFNNFNQEKINVILLGDHIGDAQLASCFSQEINIIKIGFLNYFEEDLLYAYKETFDIVVTNDGSMRIVVELLLENLKAQSYD